MPRVDARAAAQRCAILLVAARAWICLVIFRYFDLLSTDISLFLAFFGAVVFALLLGIAFHEFSHAFVATALGDPTARNLGRLSLDPRAHLDPAGTLLLFLAGFGWGKPVPFNPYNLRNGPRTGMAMVAVAGPISNLVIATVLAMPLRFGWVPWHSPFVTIVGTAGWDMTDYVGLFLSAAVLLNVILAVFNLLPVAPLDGFKVAVGLLPVELARPIARLERYGILILIGLLFFVFPAVGINIFSWAKEIADGLTGV